jgi:hypothetical protein
VLYYQDKSGQSECKLCPLPDSLNFGNTRCFSLASNSTALSLYYYLLAAVFAFIALQGIVLTVRLLRSRHSSSLRTVRSGMCLYVAMFVPYAVLQATTLGKLASLNDSILDRSVTQISSSAAFAVFFGLSFTGKLALVQMWTHVVRQHTSGGCEAPHRLQSTLTLTYKAFLWVIVVIVVMYLIGFATLTSGYLAHFEDCIRSSAETCVNVNNVKEPEQPCVDSETWTRALQYYEGIWVGVVLVLFTSLAFLFNGVVFAVYVLPAIYCAAVLCDALQVDGRARAFEVAADACALTFLALACSAAAAQGLGCGQLPDGGTTGRAARRAADAGHAAGGA